MEIAYLSSTSLRIKGKQTTIVVNPVDKAASYSAAIVFQLPETKIKPIDNVLIINGPGEYEIGGMKISGTYYDANIVYTFSVDEVRVLLVDNKTLSKYHQKLQDMDIAVVSITSDDDPSVATNVASAAVIYTGEKAEEVVNKTIKEGVTKANKFSTTKDKLPTEVQQILLQ